MTKPIPSALTTKNGTTAANPAISKPIEPLPNLTNTLDEWGVSAVLAVTKRRIPVSDTRASDDRFQSAVVNKLTGINKLLWFRCLSLHRQNFQSSRNKSASVLTYVTDPIDPRMIASEEPWQCRLIWAVTQNGAPSSLPASGRGGLSLVSLLLLLCVCTCQKFRAKTI